MTDGPPWTGELDDLVTRSLARLDAADRPAMFVLAVPAFPAARRRDESARIEVADELLRRVALGAGLDRWAGCSVAWESEVATDDYGVRVREVVAGLVDTGRGRDVTVLGVGVPRDAEGLAAAVRTGEAGGITVTILDSVDVDAVALTAAARAVGAGS